MRKETLAAIRQRRDGSVYFHKRNPVWSARRETIAIGLLVVIALLLLALIMVQPSTTLAQEPNRPAAEWAMTAIEFKVPKENTAHAALKDVAGEAVLTEAATLPSLWPVRGRLTDGFGGRRNPFRRRSSEFHPGQDIAAPQGTPVSVTADGTVVFAGCKKGYGQVVIVDHGNNISTRYGHLSQIETTVGTSIKRGEQIGLVGSTGRSTGPHLHYEVRLDEVPVNPMAYLPTVPPVVPVAINKNDLAQGDRHHDLETDQGSRRRGRHRR